MKKQERINYLLKVAHDYLEAIRDSEYGAALEVTMKWDNAECDGMCLIEDIENELNLESN